MRGGGETVTANLSIALKKIGYDVTIIANKSFFMRPNPFTDKVPIKYVPSLYELRELYRILPGISGKAAYRFQQEFYKLMLRLKRDSLINSFDILHDQGSEAAEVAVKYADKDKTIIVTLPGMPPARWKNFLSKCDYVTCASPSINSTLEKEWGLKNIIYMPHPIDLQKFKKRDKKDARERLNISGSPLILTVGRLIQAKNHYNLLRAFQKLLKNYNEAQLYIVGHGVMRSALEKLAADLKIDKNTHFTGRIAEEDLPYYYNAADVFVLVSVTDFIPCVTIEAIASECPVVVSEKVIDTVQRFPQLPVAQSDSPEDIAEKIDLVLQGKNSPVPVQEVEEFSMENVARRHALLYGNL